MHDAPTLGTWMVDHMPAAGTFLWPVGRRYCCEVLAVRQVVMGDGWPGLPLVQYRRWGWNGRPFDDGYRCDGNAGIHLRPRGPGLWSRPGRGFHRPLYGFQLFKAVGERPTGQGDLFA